MKSFKSYTDIPWPQGKRHVSHHTDGTETIEYMTTDPRREANDLFKNWFDDEGLGYGHDYWLERCPGQSVIVCFRDIHQLKYFEYRVRGASA
jgi:hypothetical protein